MHDRSETRPVPTCGITIPDGIAAHPVPHEGDRPVATARPHMTVTGSGSWTATDRIPAHLLRPGRTTPQPPDIPTLLAAFPEVATIFWGNSTQVWRALVHVNGRDDWVTADTLEHLGHALWGLLRSRRPAPPAPRQQFRASPPQAPADPRPAPGPRPVPVAPPRPGLLTRLGDRVRFWRAA
ncbi:hypothetical protein GCM10022221_44490 [Actinocorallia aurea]